MIPALLAQSLPASISPEFFGMVTLVIIFLLGFWRQEHRAAREAADRVEPKSNPPLHERFISRPEYSRDQEEIDERLSAATRSRKDMHKDIEKHTAEIAVLQEAKRTTENTLSSIDTKLTTLLQRTANLPKS